MKEDVFNAVVARNAARAVRSPGIEAPAPSVAATTRTFPLDVPHAVYGATFAANLDATNPASSRVSSRTALTALRSLPTVFLVGSFDAAVTDEIHSRVQQYVDRWSVHLGLHPSEPTSSYYNHPNRCLFLPELGKPLTLVSAFAAENTVRLIDDDWRSAPVAFNCVELVEERDAHAQRLLAELQNGAAHGRATVDRLRELEDAANEEGEPFSLDALEGLVIFASAHPNMPVPELTLSGSGGIVAEWRRSSLSVTLYFASPINVQYLVRRRNPWYRRLAERTSGATTVDRVGEALKAFLASEWPIRA